MNYVLEIISEAHLIPIGDFECEDEKSLSDYLKSDAYDDYLNSRSQKIGSTLLEDGILPIIEKIKESVGVKGIVVFSLEKSVSFYERFGFKKFDDEVQADIIALNETYSEDCYGMFALLSKDNTIEYDEDLSY